MFIGPIQKYKILDKNECDFIKNFIIENEDYIKSLGPDSYYGTKSNSLTGRFELFNYLNDSNISQILVPKLKGIFDDLSLSSPISVQCWANTFRYGEGIALHNHGSSDNRFLCANIFISGPTKPGTCYYIDNQFVKYENSPGEMHVFESDLKHYVPLNKTKDIRISLAFDIIQNNSFSNLDRYYIFE